MIRKFATIDAPVELVTEMFLDVRQWHCWMPGIKRLEILEEGQGSLVVAIDQELLGRSTRQVLECHPRDDGMSQHQRSGWMRRWHAEWRFFPPPDGCGTTVSCEIDAELGLLGLLTPKRMLERLTDRLFAEMIEQGRLRARALLAKHRENAGGPGRGQVLLQIFETAAGLEVVLDGRRYELKAVET